MPELSAAKIPLVSGNGYPALSPEYLDYFLKSAGLALECEELSTSARLLDLAQEQWDRLYEGAHLRQRLILGSAARRYAQLLVKLKVRAYQEQEQAQDWLRLLVALERMRTRHLVQLTLRKQARPNLGHLAAEQQAQARQAYEKFVQAREELTQAEERLQRIQAQLSQASEQEYLAVFDQQVQAQAQWQAQRTRLQQAAEQVRHWDPQFLPTAYTLDEQQVRTLPSCGQVLITWQTTDQSTLILLLDQDSPLAWGQTVFWLPQITSQWVEDEIYKPWYDWLQGPAGQQQEKAWYRRLEDLSRELSTAFWQPLAPYFEQHRVQELIFIPSGLLALFPCHLLRTNTHYLLEEYTISYAPSFKLLQLARQNPLPPPQQLQGIADPTADLPFTQLEAQAIPPILSPQLDQLTFVLGDEATPARVLELLGQEGLLHFACHGQFDFEDPLHNSYLILAPPEPAPSEAQAALAPEQTPAAPEAPQPPEPDQRSLLITIRDQRGLALRLDPHQEVPQIIARRNQPPNREQLLPLEEVLAHTQLRQVPLLVLSACQLGISDTKQAHEGISIASAFLCAGCPSVIAALWSVPDLPTALLIERFYQELAQGQPLAPALCQAQLYIRDITVKELRQYLHTWHDQVNAAEIRLRMKLRYWLDTRIANWPASWQPFQHPYYWAAFYLSGANNTLFNSPSQN